MAPNIIVSRPTFPTYLLPSTYFLPFRRRPSPPSTPDSPPDESKVPSLSSSPTSSTTDETTTPPDSPRPPPPPSYKDAITSSPKPATRRGAPSRLTRTHPDTLRCGTCSCDIAFSSQIVSKGFTGRYGRAYLVAPTPLPPSSPASVNSANSGAAGPGMLTNTRIGRCENRQLVTGWHVVADITCALCSAKLGWKYVDAKELSQKYKVGKFILEVERVVPFRSWEDISANGYNDSDEDEVAEDEIEEVEPKRAINEVADGDERGNGDEDIDREGSASEEVEIVFDSDDEDELEELFSGTWDPKVVAKRRSRRVNAARSK